MKLTGLADDELLSRRHQALLRLARAQGSRIPEAGAHDDIKQINQELDRRRQPHCGAKRPESLSVNT
jgi:hypothetical protein